jgi:hypothetical protein
MFVLRSERHTALAQASAASDSRQAGGPVRTVVWEGAGTVRPFEELRAFAAVRLRLCAQAATAACLRPGAQTPFAGIAGPTAP